MTEPDSPIFKGTRLREDPHAQELALQQVAKQNQFVASGFIGGDRQFRGCGLDREPGQRRSGVNRVCTCRSHPCFERVIQRLFGRGGDRFCERADQLQFILSRSSAAGWRCHHNDRGQPRIRRRLLFQLHRRLCDRQLLRPSGSDPGLSVDQRTPDSPKHNVDRDHDREPEVEGHEGC